MEFHLRKTFGAPMYYGVFRGSFGSPSFDRVLNLFRDLVVENLLLENFDIEFDCLKIEVWPDSGSVFAFPGLLSSRHRVERVGIHVVICEFERLFEVYGEESEEEVLEENVVRLLDQLENAIFDKLFSCRESLIRSGIREIVFYQFDEAEPLSKRSLE